MPYRIAIASGKGGTGKTSVAVSLYYHLVKRFCNRVHLVDCDVEEPNDALFFNECLPVLQETIDQEVPRIDTSICTFCRKCSDYCEFNAIVVIPPVHFAEVNSSLCHSCGACLVACKEGAITEYPKSIGEVVRYDTGFGGGLSEGRLEIGSAMQTMLIKELKSRVPDDNEIVIYDAPPGTSCPVVETLSDANYVILVTEPTPFGLYDLQLMVGLMKGVDKPFGIIVNKAGLGNLDVFGYLEKEGLELLGEIPFSQEYATMYAKGAIFEGVPENIEDCYANIIQLIEQKITVDEGNNYFKW
jgi:MinD superfamily P-loop ATPase